MTDQRETTAPASAGPVDLDNLLDLALHMANRADELALAGFASRPRAEIKPDGSPVTRVDREVETVIRDTIEREHPRAGVLGEEYGDERGLGRWVIDPIDGTRELIDGDPRFSILIAYELADVPLVGVVSSPALELRWWAAEDAGARRSYKGEVTEALVSGTRRMSRAHGMVLGGFHSEGWPDRTAARRLESALMTGGARLNRRGVSWEAIRVSAGEYDFALTTGYRWDIAPLPVIVREAGGWAHMTGGDGGLHRLAVSNGQLATDIERIVGL